MELMVDGTHLGTPESVWQSWGVVEGMARLEPVRPQRVVVIAPHPDDEVLGAGGLIHQALAEGVPIEVVAVTDGEASHPPSAVGALDLRAVRAREARLALQRLGWATPRVTRLGLPDGQVAEHLPELRHALDAYLVPGTLCVAPWRGDGHPDHDACGGAAASVGTSAGVRTLGYLVWTWHWATPHEHAVPWSRCRRLDLSRRGAARKRWATGAFRSQIRPLGRAAEAGPTLPAPVLRRFWRGYEVYVDESAAG